MKLIPPYRSPGGEPTTDPGGLHGLPWVGPRAVVESHDRPMLPLGGVPSVDLPAHIVDAVAAAAGHAGYPATSGWRDLRIAIAEDLAASLGRKLDPESEILVTVGSMQALHLAARVCCHDSGGIAHAPGFFYEDIAKAALTTCSWIGSKEASPDWSALESAIVSGQHSALFVNTPVNPSGYVFTETDIEALARTCAGRAIWIVSDEAYSFYMHDGRQHLSPAAHPDLADQTLLIRSFSKTYALGSWRIGYAAGPEALISAMAKLLQYTILGVPMISQVAALAALTGPQEWARQLVADCGQWRRPVVDAINGTGLMKAEMPQSGTTAWASITSPKYTEQTMGDFLVGSLGIPAVAGSLFGAATPHLRIPFSGTLSAVPELVKRLQSLDTLDASSA